MTDLISRADAIETVLTYFIPRSHTGERGEHEEDFVRTIFKALPSADVEPTVIRSITLLPTKDFKEWAKRIKEVNPNAVVIPCDAEVVLADAVSREDTVTLNSPISIQAEMVAVVRCKDCRHANECHKSVQYTRNEQSTVTIGYTPIEWCSRGEK